LNIDIAPTLVDLAEVSDGSEEFVDGQSFKSLLVGNLSTVDPVPNWRTEFLVEHDGEVQDVVKGCPELNNQQVSVSI